MRITDDIGGLNKVVTDQRTAERVLSKQVKHVDRVLPYFLSGMLVTGLVFFIMMEFGLHTSILKAPLHFFWIICHSCTVGVGWFLWKKVLSSSTHITHKLIKNIFLYLMAYFLITDVMGCFLYFYLNQQDSFIQIQPKLFYIWMVYHNVVLCLCYFNWKNIDKVILDIQKRSPLSPLQNFVDVKELSFTPEKKHQIDYLASYTAYKVLFTCMLLLGCLWAIGVVQVITNDVDFSVNMIILVGLNFAIISSAMSSIGIFRQVFNVFAMPSLITWAAILLYIEDTHLVILSLVIIIFVITHSFFARYNWLNSIKTIQIYLENTYLVSQLEAKSQQLQRISTAKTHFLATASHDLRQPAHALSLFIETLSRTNLNDTQRNIVDYAKTACQSSSDMLNTILDYAHLESGEMIPNFVATDLDYILQNLVDEFSAEAKSKGLGLKYRSTTLCVDSDPAMLSLILRNFLSNALRYTLKGRILIGVRCLCDKSKGKEHRIDKEYCRVSVWDTGEGIATEDLEGVFDSFTQLQRNTKSNQGLGLGLSIAKGLAKILNVPINVQSKFGQGSHFYIDLPICQNIKHIKGLEECIKTNKEAMVSVLVVDDEDTVLIAMKLLLQSWGYKVLGALDVEQALTQYRLYHPQIVITDYQLANDKTGAEVLKGINILAGLHETALLPQCLILTGNTSPDIIKLSNQIDVELLHKPITSKALHSKLKELVAKV